MLSFPAPTLVGIRAIANLDVVNKAASEVILMNDNLPFCSKCLSRSTVGCQRIWTRERITLMPTYCADPGILKRALQGKKGENWWDIPG